MLSFDASTTISASPEAVWTVLTDLGAYSSWDSGVTRTEGEIAPGAKIKLWTEVSPGRAFPLKVATLDRPSTMVWTGGMPLGLFTGTRTFTLTPDDAGTHVNVHEDFEGPLLGLMRRSLPDLQPSFDRFVAGLKARAEATA